MNYEKLGMVVTIGIIIGLFGFLHVTDMVLDSVTSTFHDYCTKMNIDCR